MVCSRCSVKGRFSSLHEDLLLIVRKEFPQAPGIVEKVTVLDQFSAGTDLSNHSYIGADVNFVHTHGHLLIYLNSDRPQMRIQFHLGECIVICHSQKSSASFQLPQLHTIQKDT